MSYYPDGTGPSDKNAPWNWQEPIYTECEECEDGSILISDGVEEELRKCEKCNGTGYYEEDEND